MLITIKLHLSATALILLGPFHFQRVNFGMTYGNLVNDNGLDQARVAHPECLNFLHACNFIFIFLACIDVLPVNNSSIKNIFKKKSDISFFLTVICLV